MSASDTRPDPDPTVMTTEQLDRSIGCVREILETRLNGMDTAIELLQSTSDKFPARIDEKILALKDVHDEKFRSIQKQFDERDVRTDTSRVSDKTAVDAALAAQEKSFSKQGETFSDATLKSEQQFTKQMDQIRELHQTEIRGLQAQFYDLKDRFNRGEGRGEGSKDTKSAQMDSNKYLIAVIGLLFTATMVYLALRRG